MVVEGDRASQVGAVSTAQRVRLDCDREASHNLNRLLYKPGGAAVNLLVMEIYL